MPQNFIPRLCKSFPVETVRAREAGIEIQGGKAECMLIEGDATYLILDRGFCKQASKENRIFRDSVLRLLLRDFHRELRSGLRPRHS